MQPAHDFAILYPPLLAHDAAMLSRYGFGVSPNGQLERKIVWNLLAHLRRAGFEPKAVYDGVDKTSVECAAAAMELVFNLDEARLLVSKAGREHWLLLVLGNGVDLVADWGVPRHSDGFDEAMCAFDAEIYA